MGHRWTSEHENCEVLLPSAEHQQSLCSNQRFWRERAEPAIDKALDVVDIRVNRAGQVGARGSRLQGNKLPSDAECFYAYATRDTNWFFIVAFDWNQPHSGKWPRALGSIRLKRRLRCRHCRSRRNWMIVATKVEVSSRRMWTSGLMGLDIVP
jgi:hypothetical protein